MKRVFLLLSLVATPAFAQDGIEVIDGRRVQYKLVTEIDIEGATVGATLNVPEVKLTIERPAARFNPMIKLRYDFDAEMSESVDEVK